MKLQHSSESPAAAVPYFGCYAPMRNLVIFLLALVTIGLCSCAHAEVHYSGLPKNSFTVTEEKLHEIILADGSIPKRYWGKPIQRLKPIRVLSHRINIAVVTSENDKTFSGVYFSVIYSSYLPVNSDTEQYFRDNPDNLIHFTFKK